MKIFVSAVVSAFFSSAVYADSPFSIEVNTAQSVESGCNLSFFINNEMDLDLNSAIFETVILDTSGHVSQLSLFDFGTLPANRTRVRQFLISGTQCDAIGHILFNGATTCEGKDLTPKICDKALSLSSRTHIEVSG